MEKTAQEDLVRYIERLENLDVDAKAIAEDKKQVKKDMKSKGYDMKMVTKILKLRAMDEADLEEEAMMLETYCNACGVKQFTLGLG